MGLGIESQKLENNPDIISRVLVVGRAGLCSAAWCGDAGAALRVRVPLRGDAGAALRDRVLVVVQLGRAGAEVVLHVRVVGLCGNNAGAALVLPVRVVAQRCNTGTESALRFRF